MKRIHLSVFALTVEIPPARNAEGVHAYSYELRACDAEGRILQTRRLLAEDFNLPAVSRGLPTRCVFSPSDIASAVRFDAMPLDSFGNKGKWISSYE